MAELMRDMKRSCRCAELDESMLGRRLTLMGWCHRQRDLGGVIFINLRDRSGEVQLMIGDRAPEEARAKAARVRAEFVLAATGTLVLRQAANKELATGAYELEVDELRILSEAQTPPFYIEDGVEANEALRLKYRYLDLRRPEMQRNLMLRSRMTKVTHDYFDEQGFVDVETPMLGKSTPEGARDYLVPSRVKPGNFFALPQSPQLYKQLLMLAGYDRYIQIARCFRDEDLRADRQPEFTQVDLEMAFVQAEDVMGVVEGYVARVLKELFDIDCALPLPVMSYEEAMRRFGSDKPDLRFGMELQDISALVAESEFMVFRNALAAGGSVQCLVVPGGAALSRKEIDGLQSYVLTYRLKGLAWLAPGAAPRGSVLKFFDAAAVAELAAAVGAAEGDLILMAADTRETVQNGLGQLRCELARRLGLLKEGDFKLLWVTEFPLFEYDKEEGRFVAKHHPFTSPMDEDLALLERAPEKVRAKAYDLVLNGTELGGGSIRIHDQALQRRMFELLGFSEEAAWENFGFLLEAFKYGVPPHGGCALGLDRFVMLMTGAGSIREVIAFPKVQTSADLMTEAPGTVSEKQLDELCLDLKRPAAGADEAQD